MEETNIFYDNSKQENKNTDIKKAAVFIFFLSFFVFVSTNLTFYLKFFCSKEEEFSILSYPFKALIGQYFDILSPFIYKPSVGKEIDFLALILAALIFYAFPSLLLGYKILNNKLKTKEILTSIKKMSYLILGFYLIFSIVMIASSPFTFILFLWSAIPAAAIVFYEYLILLFFGRLINKLFMTIAN
jgi:hypothetical protein